MPLLRLAASSREPVVHRPLQRLELHLRVLLQPAVEARRELSGELGELVAHRQHEGVEQVEERGVEIELALEGERGVGSHQPEHQPLEAHDHAAHHRPV